jgi:hypothetical protein
VLPENKNAADMEMAVDIGMVEGLQQAVSQMDALLAGRTASG